MSTFLICLWLISGLFWYMCFEIASAWPTKSLYAFLISFLLFAALFAVLMATNDDDEGDDSLGCTVQEIKAHIDRLKDERMEWSDFGTRWHIVHRLPLKTDNPNETAEEALADLCKRFHYTNSEPKWDEQYDPRSMVKIPNAVKEKKEGEITEVQVHN